MNFAVKPAVKGTKLMPIDVRMQISNFGEKMRRFERKMNHWMILRL
jgi:hypothetical protein